MHASLKSFQRLLTIMDDLREKCPWDREQTMESLRTLSIEEIYELSEAIINEDANEIKKELGDLFLHLVFYAKIAQEKGWFDVSEVLESICDKLVQRHPHIYGEVSVNSAEQVKQNWEAIKLKNGSKGVLSGVPQSLPALVKAYRMQEKAAGVHFDWPNAEGAKEKMLEELAELEEAAKTTNRAHQLEEAGDLLFSVVNYCRKLGLNAEDALELSNRKFQRRFQDMETSIHKAGLDITKLDLDTLESFYQQAKAKEA
jgi:MazG family protein